jgi:alpha-glucosidase
MIRAYNSALPVHAWPNWVLGNHDNPRVASRIGTTQARVAAVLLLTLRGTPTLYYGDEIGMTDGHIAPDEIRDPVELRQPGMGQGRDPERTPMQWDNSLPNAGFTSGRPWLPVGTTPNVRDQDRDASSTLSLYRRLLALRRSNPALVEGTIENVVAHGDVLTYERRCRNQRLFMALNMGFEECDRAISSGGALAIDASRSRRRSSCRWRQPYCVRGSANRVCLTPVLRVANQTVQSGARVGQSRAAPSRRAPTSASRA